MIKSESKVNVSTYYTGVRISPMASFAIKYLQFSGQGRFNIIMYKKVTPVHFYNKCHKINLLDTQECMRPYFKVTISKT